MTDTDVYTAGLKAALDDGQAIAYAALHFYQAGNRCSRASKRRYMCLSAAYENALVARNALLRDHHYLGLAK